jgi:hypothetical protein
VRTDAQRRVHGLRADPLSEIDAWLEPIALLVARLDALERHPRRVGVAASARGSLRPEQQQ